MSRGMLSHSQDAVRSDTMRTGGGSLDIARLLKLDLLDLRVVAPGDGALEGIGTDRLIIAKPRLPSVQVSGEC